MAFHPVVYGSICSDYANTESVCGGTQFAVQRGKRKGAPLGKFKVGSVIHREPEAVGHVQRFAPGVDIRVVVCGDVQERKIGKSGAAEVRIYATSTHGHSQTIGD